MSDRHAARRHFNLQLGEPWMIEAGGRLFEYRDCAKFAEIANVPADIFQEVLKSRDKQFLLLTVVSEETEYSAFGVGKGWYEARLISEEEAKQWRQSWAILRPQPADPMGPWE